MKRTPEIDLTSVLSGLIRQARYTLRVDRLGSWSKDLKEISLLDLHILELASDKTDITLKEIRQELEIPTVL